MMGITEVTVIIMVCSPEASVLPLVLAIRQRCLISSTVDILQGEIPLDQAEPGLSCRSLRLYL